MTLRGEVWDHELLAGVIEETPERSYRFVYDNDYLMNPSRRALSVTLPLSQQIHEADRLFGFFDGLIPEGWLLNITSRQWKIDRNDRMRLLLAVCGDCIGSVSVIDKSEGIKLVAGSESISETHSDTLPKTKLQDLKSSFNNSRCLKCLREVSPSEGAYHKRCAKELFGRSVAPTLDVAESDIERLGVAEVNKRLTVTGVQRKLSLSIDKSSDDPGGRLTIVGLWGDYILKPAPSELPSMSANEHLVMSIAAELGLPTPQFGLIPFKDGGFAYITKRFDRLTRLRNKIAKVAVEDFGQIFNRNQGAMKYGASYNQIGRWLKENSSQPGLDVVRLFETVLFSFLIGNSDLHLKNITVVTEDKVLLSPIYDLVSVEALEPGDDEELALPMGGRKNKLRRSDFLDFAEYIGIPENVFERILSHYLKLEAKTSPLIEHSFIPEEEKQRFRELIVSRVSRLKKL